MAELILSMKGREMLRIPITKTQTVIGRSPQADLQIDNAGVSRHHAVVVAEDNTFTVLDQGSQNGIYVNGRPVDEVALHHGDKIQIGKFEVTFSSKGGVSASRLEEVDGAQKFKEIINSGDDKTFTLSAEEVARVLEKAKMGGAPPKPTNRPPVITTQRRHKSVRRQVAQRAQTKSSKGGGYGGLITLLVLLVLGLGGAVVYLLMGK